jgi:hypothetical protein
VGVGAGLVVSVAKAPPERGKKESANESTLGMAKDLNECVFIDTSMKMVVVKFL